MLIPNVVFCRKAESLKAGILRNLSLEEGSASHQLVGKVKAYQGFTGSRPERVIGHTGTETLPRLLREAAVEDHSQCAKA